jgi:hypothetical protein
MKCPSWVPACDRRGLVSVILAILVLLDSFAAYFFTLFLFRWWLEKWLANLRRLRRIVLKLKVVSRSDIHWKFSSGMSSFTAN